MIDPFPALHVPTVDVAEPASRLDLIHWLQNLLGSDSAVYEVPDPDTLARTFAFSEICRLESFWDEEGPASLTNRVAALVGALGRANSTVLVVARRSGPRFSWMFGFDDHSGSLAPALGSALPGAVVRNLADGAEEFLRDGLAGRGRLALVGTPTRLTAPREVPLLERLATASVEQWTLLSLARPVDPSELLRRYEGLSLLRRQTAAFARATRTVTEVESREDVDPVAELATAMLKREERRSLQATRVAAFAAQTWLVADTAELAALGALAAASLGGEATQARPLRVRPEGRVGIATTLLLPEELASIVQPPVHDVRGFEVRRWARFDVQPEETGVEGPRLRLGRTPTHDDVTYPVDALTTHALIGGATGSGKSSLLRALLEQVGEVCPDVAFLVVEPTKDEYATLPVPGLEVWRIGDASDRSWRLNPLEVPEGIPLQTHVDLLVALFESTFALFPPLPYLIEMGLRQVYAERGWDLVSGRNAHAEADPDYPALPTLRDMQSACLDLVDDLGYVGEVRHNVRGALQARLGSLLEGPKGALVDTDERLDMQRLLNGPCVVNLDLVGSDREKAFFMGLLLIRLWEARRGHRSRRLRHLTVLEEAHRILPAEQARPTDPMVAGGNFAAETFTNLLAEVRAAGEGIVVVEQSPRQLATGAVTNTGLKVAFRTMGAEDRQVLAGAMNVGEEQAQALASLDRHESLVFWAGMDAPVRMRSAAAFPPDGSPPAQQRLSPAPPVVRDPVVGRLADLLLRVSDEEAEPVRRALVDRVELVLPAVLADRVDDVVVAMLGTAAERLGRARGLPQRVRQEMVDRALADPPRGTVLPPVDGDCSCDGGGVALGCPVRELVEEAVRSWSREGRSPAEVTSFSALHETAAHLRLRVLEAFGTDTAQATVAQGVGCLAAHALRGTRPLAQVREFRLRVLAQEGD